MKKQNRGIVLFKKNTMVSMIDENNGRFFATTFGNLMLGGLYIYDLKPYKNGHTLIQEELIAIPFELPEYDIIFFHHLLEICLLFTPLGSCTKSLFQLLSHSYSESFFWSSNKNKKFLLFKMLVLLDIWPQPNSLNTQLLQFAEIPIDRINKEILELVSEKEIEYWILHATRQDPMFTKMKTKIFLESMHGND